MVPERMRDGNSTNDTKIHGESNVLSTAQRQEISTDLMFMLVLKETIHRLDMANRVHWFDHVLRRGDGHVLRRALDLEPEGQRKKEEAKEDVEKAGQGRKNKGWFEKGRCTLPFKVECRRTQDCCWVEVNLVTPTHWGYHQILNIGVSLTLII